MHAVYIPLHLMRWLAAKPCYRSLEDQPRDADPTTTSITLFA